MFYRCRAYRFKEQINRGYRFSDWRRVQGLSTQGIHAGVTDTGCGDYTVAGVIDAGNIDTGVIDTVIDPEVHDSQRALTRRSPRRDSQPPIPGKKNEEI